VEFQNRSASPRIFFSLDLFTNTKVEKRAPRKPNPAKNTQETTIKISGHDARAAVRDCLKETSAGGEAKFIVVEGADFGCCVTPIKDLVVLRLSNKKVELYPGEAQQINANTLLSEFVPAVIEANRTGQPRRQLKAVPPGRTDSMEIG